MTPQDFLQKVEAGTLSEADTKQFLDSVSGKLEELKAKDPAKYLEILRGLNAAVEAMNKTLESV